MELILNPGESATCPNCGGSGDDPETMICVMCGGDGTLSYDDYEMAFPEMNGEPLVIETDELEAR